MTVTTPEGTSATSQADQYGYGAPPTVTSVKPKEWVAGPNDGGGIEVTIKGTNLAGAKAVMFGSLPARSFTVENVKGVPTIKARTPEQAVAGIDDVTVTTPTGTSAVTSKDRFKFQPTPVHLRTLVARLIREARRRRLPA